MIAQACHPGQLVIEFLGLHGIAVRQIDGGDPHAAGDRLQVPGLDILFVARQGNGLHLDGMARQHRDAVIGLLSDRGGIVARRLDFH